MCVCTIIVRAVNYRQMRVIIKRVLLNYTYYVMCVHTHKTIIAVGTIDVNRIHNRHMRVVRKNTSFRKSTGSHSLPPVISFRNAVKICNCQCSRRVCTRR